MAQGSNLEAAAAASGRPANDTGRIVHTRERGDTGAELPPARLHHFSNLDEYRLVISFFTIFREKYSS